MSGWRRALISSEATIRDAIACIDASGLQIALVVERSGKLLGTITDGDIRRGMLRGKSLDESAAEIMVRTPSTVTLKQGREAALAIMREKQIGQVPVLDAAGRVAGLETRDEHLTDAALDTWVVVMAGGMGKRLSPLTDETPKPLLPVGGKPLLETVVEKLAQQGFQRIFLSVNYKAEMFRKHFGDGARWGSRIEYLCEAEQLGTAGALSLLPTPLPAQLIVMNGDLLTAIDFRHLIDFHQAQGAVATMCVREYSFQVPYGVALLEEHWLSGISEKPEHRFFINAGIYALGPEAVARVPHGRRFDMTALFEQLIAEKQRAAAFPIREYWLDIGQIDDLKQARDEFSRIFG
ncbi:MAG: nucleotidyltransferase family protein [Kiloniellales bacterium]